jgi:CRISPR-associated endonuclease Cas1
MVSGRNRHATHPLNAMLNYAYAVLESQVRTVTVSHGLDPTIGYLHTRRPGRAALVYDLMEPLRPQVDRLALNFARASAFVPSDFILNADGICRLHPQLAKKVAQLTVGDTAVQAIVLKVKENVRMMRTG